MSESATAGADWMRGTRRSAVQDRILEIAGAVFGDRGPDASMSQIAAAVGCSRATLYRYFDGRRRLQVAYVDRVARRISAAVAADVVVEDPGERFTESVLTALEHVRAEPALAAWFVPRGAGVASELALSSELIERAAVALLGDESSAPADGDRLDAARWVVRVIVSLLAVPGGTPAQERATIARFVAPVVVGRRGLADTR
ncbi:TetR/AcrR family transcriptional regulator [Gordonia hydrophobica]|uniref:TetR/AcrR family transcriptional regulator n=1 Tax=Gordonia hydrophobica TaxID=40516 RepID=A0ABZ2U1W6_9ACTN|nr:TetR/AcrR family transcriptional regulator [Gordonia hydrophobica]MBM7366762.1 AcrR family transcriptional regulator [Gordonia hydrophobica]